MTITKAIQILLDRRNLSEGEASMVAAEIMAGIATPAQIAALLIALRTKGETVEEITGFVRAMRNGALQVKAKSENIVDTCGTGGDRSGTFNISTVSAFVAAGAGCKVAKHGNRSVTSQCGSADVLKALGVNIEMSPEQAADCIDEIGVGFLFAPQYHPGARHAASVRREIGVRTIFNMIGPLLNPAGARRQVMGVYDRRLTVPIARVLQRLGSQHCIIVHGEDGLDEITPCGRTYITELRDGEIFSYSLRPEVFGFDPAKPADLMGGDAEKNASIASAILDGQRGPRRDVVVMNAGATIYASGFASSLIEGVRRAALSIDSGAAREALRNLVVGVKPSRQRMSA